MSKIVHMVWNIKDKDMLNVILETDAKEDRQGTEDYSPMHYVGKSREYIREIYSEYLGLESLTNEQLIQEGYYRLEIA
jgi:hypothetical protein